MYNIPVFKQLVELLHWILVTLNTFFAGLELGPDWSWGLAIIGLTIIVRLILFPLTWKQYSNAHALQALQPKMRELQRKYKDDRAKLQQETMKLYQEHRVNPFASCLPLLLQLPVFIALYAAISGNATYLDQTTVKEMADAGFLWIKSVAEGGGGLGKPDPTHILLVLYVATQLVSTELMLQTQTDKAQKWLMRGMPVFFVFILWNFPSGLFVYWVTTNLWTIGQQLIIRKVMKPYAAPTDADSKKRSRLVDALVQANEAGQKARAERAAAARKVEQRRAAPSRQRASGGAGADATGAATPGGAKQTGAKPGISAQKPSGRTSPRNKGKTKSPAQARPAPPASGAAAGKPDRPAATPRQEGANQPAEPGRARTSGPAQRSRRSPASTSNPAASPDAAGDETTQSGPNES